MNWKQQALKKKMVEEIEEAMQLGKNEGFAGPEVGKTTTNQSQ